MEEKEAVEKLNKMLNDTIQVNKCGLSNNDFKEDIEVLETALNLLEKKDKIIDEMAEYIPANQTNCSYKKCNTDENGKILDNCKECIKQYFEKKAEE